MSTAIRYIEYLQSKIREVPDHEIPNIENAARLMADSCLPERLEGYAPALINQVITYMVKAGVEPLVFVSSNVDGGNEKNAQLYETYYGYWK